MSLVDTPAPTTTPPSTVDSPAEPSGGSISTPAAEVPAQSKEEEVRDGLFGLANRVLRRWWRFDSRPSFPAFSALPLCCVVCFFEERGRVRAAADRFIVAIVIVLLVYSTAVLFCSESMICM